MIGIKIARNRKNVAKTIKDSQRFGPVIEHEKAVTKTALIVIGSFLILNLPAAIIVVKDPLPPGKAEIPGKSTLTLKTFKVFSNEYLKTKLLSSFVDYTE